MDHITFLVAVVILTSAPLGFALSTTPAEVRWGVAGRMVIAWLVTLPAAALVGGLAASAVTHGGNLGTTVVALVGVTVAVVTGFALGVLGPARVEGACRSSTEIRDREQG